MKRKILILLIVSLILVSCSRTSLKKEQGGLGSSKIDKVVRSFVPQIMECQEKHLSNGSKENIKAAWTINSNGKVYADFVKKSKLGNRKFEKCIIAVIKLMSFPKPISGGTVSIEYPFVFEKP